MSAFRLTAAALTVLGAATLAFAAEPQRPNVSETKVGPREGSAVETLRLADDLAIYGIRNADAVAIAQAAKIKKSVPESALGATKTTQGEAAATTADAKTSGYDLGADALIARAESMAGNNALVKRLIAEAKAEKSRGARGGVKSASERVMAGRTDVYQVEFVGGELAQVGVRGDGDTDLDLYVYDEYNNLICRDADYTDRLYCQWTPRWSGVFKIEVRNLGRVYNVYTILTN